MPESTQSFTLDDAERQHILGNRSYHSAPEVDDDGAIVASLSSEKAHDVSRTDALRKSVSTPNIFECSYTQNFTQTQEDTSSFKRQLDDAPPVPRQEHAIENVFDTLDNLRPLETSTAVQHESLVAPCSPTPSLSEGNGKADTMEQIQTPAVTHFKTLETPAGLTQMFQSSQDTPVLLHRKSTYVSMKDSQEHRIQTSDNEDESAEEDPDFPRIRHYKPTASRAMAHSVMQRLRERTTLRDIKPPDSDSMFTDPPDRDTSDGLGQCTIPASAPQITSSQVTDIAAQSQEPDSIITDSQPTGRDRHVDVGLTSTQLSSHRNVSSQGYDTIVFNLHSSLPGSTAPNNAVSESHNCHQASETTAELVVSQHMIHEAEVLTAGSEDCLSTDHAQTLGPKSVTTTERAELDLPLCEPNGLTECQQKTPQISNHRSGHIAHQTSSGSDNKSLRRSASHSLASYTTPIHASVGTSARSKSMQMISPFNYSTDHSPPVLQVGHKRKVVPLLLVEESPMESAKVSRPSKQDTVFSSLPEEYSDDDLIRPQVQVQGRRKRLKTLAEVEDSQYIRSKPQMKQNTAHSASNLPSTSRSPNRWLNNEHSRTDSDQEVSSSGSISSSLTSLASDDFVQGSSDEPRTRPCVSQWSKRVFALYRANDLYYPASLASDIGLNEHHDPGKMVPVEFDDTNETLIELDHVRPLDLRIGDSVKVDLTGVKSKRWIIIALHNDGNNSTQFTDIHGHTGFEARRADNGAKSTFRIDQIYLPASLYKAFQKRYFAQVPRPEVGPQPSTPSRRQPARIKSASPAVSYKGSDRGRAGSLFDGLAFSVTFSTSKPAHRERVERKLMANGGVLLPGGLDTLFKSVPFSEDHDIAPLDLTTMARSLSAVLVISDHPSRKAKYLQALSLGLPCLHESYVDDCIEAGCVLAMDSYLLAAGEGRIRDSVVTMSMVCAMTLPNSPRNTLASQIKHRKQVYARHRVIVVTGPDRDARKIHLFLSWAMGCADLTECVSLEEAHHLLVRPEDGKVWDLVSVQELSMGGHKMRALLKDLRGRVVTNEDVVQSLITGRLCISH